MFLFYIVFGLNIFISHFFCSLSLVQFVYKIENYFFIDFSFYCRCDFILFTVWKTMRQINKFFIHDIWRDEMADRQTICFCFIWMISLLFSEYIFFFFFLSITTSLYFYTISIKFSIWFVFKGWTLFFFPNKKKKTTQVCVKLKFKFLDTKYSFLLLT